MVTCILGTVYDAFGYQGRDFRRGEQRHVLRRAGVRCAAEKRFRRPQTGRVHFDFGTESRRANGGARGELLFSQLERYADADNATRYNVVVERTRYRRGLKRSSRELKPFC